MPFPLTTVWLHPAQHHSVSFLGHGFPHGYHLWRTEKVSQRKSPCSVIALWLVPLVHSCLYSSSASGFDLLGSHGAEQDCASPVWMGVLQGKHRCTRKHSDDSMADNCLPERDSKPIKNRGFFFPMNFNRDWMRHNIVFNLHLRARVRQHCISGSPGLLVGGVVSFLLLLLLFLMKSSQH